MSITDQIAEDPRLGTMPDIDLAAAWDVSREVVRRARALRGIPRYTPPAAEPPARAEPKPTREPVPERTRRRLICAVARTGRSWGEVARAVPTPRGTVGIQLSQLMRKIAPPPTTPEEAKDARPLYPEDVAAIATAAGLTVEGIEATEAEPGDEALLVHLHARGGRAWRGAGAGEEADGYAACVVRFGDSVARMLALGLVARVEDAIVLTPDGRRAARA